MDAIGIGLIVVIVVAIIYMAYTKKREKQSAIKYMTSSDVLKVKEPRARTEKIYKSGASKAEKKKPSKKKSTKSKTSSKKKTKKKTREKGKSTKKPTKKTGHKCSKCGRSFKTKRGLSIHKAKSH